MVKAWAILGITSWKWSSCVRTVCSKISAVGPEPAFKYLKRVPSPSLAYSISPDGDQVLVWSLFGLDSVRIVSSSRYLPGLPERPSCAVRSTLARISPRIESTVEIKRRLRRVTAPTLGCPPTDGHPSFSHLRRCPTPARHPGRTRRCGRCHRP